MRTVRLLLPTPFLTALPVAAQLTLPRANQRASVTQTIGSTKITVDYHPPRRERTRALVLLGFGP